jgi:hypothetical protein
MKRMADGTGKVPSGCLRHGPGNLGYARPVRPEMIALVPECVSMSIPSYSLRVVAGEAGIQKE